MRLETVTLQNFRGFEKLDIKFEPDFTVLLGQNMAGKSAVLDGVAVGLGGLLWNVIENARGIRGREVRCALRNVEGVPDLQQVYPVVVEVRARAESAGELVWTVRRERRTLGETELRENGAVFGLLPTLIGSLDPRDLPVLAQYGTERAWQGESPLVDTRGVGSRIDGYEGCFDISSTHSALAAWMRKQTLIQLQRGGTYRQPQLAAVEAAVCACIEGARAFWFDVQYDELRVGLENGDIQSFSMLSEGYRNMVALVADIAWRAAVLNPHRGVAAAAETGGVVLIDEVDLHLHPSWQRRIVGDLRRTFPKIQFIVTTHSPQIVASVARRQVRLLHQNSLVADELFVEGRDTNSLLEDVFGVPSRPAKVTAEIDALYRLLEDEDFDAARVALDRLQERLGTDDVAIIRARWMLETELADREHDAAPAP